MAKNALIVCLPSLIVVLMMFHNNAYAHVMVCGQDRCEAINVQGYIETHHPFIAYLSAAQGFIFIIVASGITAFGIFVILKNRARKIAC